MSYGNFRRESETVAKHLRGGDSKVSEREKEMAGIPKERRCRRVNPAIGKMPANANG